MTVLTLESGALEAVFSAPDDAPVTLVSVRVDGVPVLVAPSQLAVVFTDGERQSSRMSSTYADSALAKRLRFRSAEHTDDGLGSTVTIVQADTVTGVVLTTVATALRSATALRLSHTVTNEGASDITLLAISSALVSTTAAASLDLVWGESGWVSEGRWQRRALDDLLGPVGLPEFGQDAAGVFGLTSEGSWSTGRFLPTGVLVDRAGGAAMAWQIESSGAWRWEVGETATGAYLAVLGPTDAEHQFATALAPGGSFTAPTAALAFATGGFDAALAALTDYRRSLRELRPADAALPVIYNDFMNTLMGEPSTEKLEPLIRAAAAVGAEYFCIDAGWFAEPGSGDWWSRVGEWREAESRFTGGLARSIDLIVELGMVPGLWLEPEVIGVDSPAAGELPDDAFFCRFGRRVVTQGRYHLDFRHEAAREHVDRAIDDLVARFGIGMFKLDYNINPGTGTEVGALAAGAGLLGHVRAHREWWRAVQQRHPDVLFENCGSGAMRMDYGLLSLAHVQSTSDQQDFLRYPAIAVGALASVLPEQAGNWAYPSAGLTPDETAFSLVAGLVGRLYLSGFLDELDEPARDLVTEAVSVSKQWRDRVAASHPVWPLGLPQWQAEHLAVALDCGSEYLLAVWSRGGAAEVRLEFAQELDAAQQVFPHAHPEWPAVSDGGRLTISVPQGPAARLIRIGKKDRA